MNCSPSENASHSQHNNEGQGGAHLQHDELHHNEWSDADMTYDTDHKEIIFTESAPMVTNVSKKSKKNSAPTLSIEDVNKAAYEFFQSRKHSAENESEDSDLSFFKSILPDVREMNAEQKRRFRIGILNLVQEILD